MEWLGPILVRGLRLLSSVEALGQEFSFSQAMVLITLLNMRQTSMNKLAEVLGISKANASGLVDRLVKKRLVERDRSTEDRRVVLVQLTPAGIKTAQQLAKLNRQGLVKMMRRIPDQNLKVFIDTLEQLAQGLIAKK
ncbi:MAG: MarR family transcriptional regulator [candidate division WOR-3 bacterium]|nr:MarR family transcriptional regulator [candidate division WOR-3 bacterium]MDH7518846.1 MarR family transcriptional regulator [bacterium]